MRSAAAAFRLSSPWLALLIPIILYGALACLRALAPGLFCAAVNPGGREFICGRDYSHVGVNLTRLIGPIVWAVALLVGGIQVIGGRAGRASTCAWLFSAALFLALIVLLITAPNDDAP